MQFSNAGHISHKFAKQTQPKKLYWLLFIQVCVSCSAANVSSGKPLYNKDMDTEHDSVLQYPKDTVRQT